MSYAIRIPKAEWTRLGGLRNSNCWRRQVRGAWHYFLTVDNTLEPPGPVAPPPP